MSMIKSYSTEFWIISDQKVIVFLLIIFLIIIIRVINFGQVTAGRLEYKNRIIFVFDLPCRYASYLFKLIAQ